MLPCVDLHVRGGERTAVGRAIAVHCAGALKKASLELGGKNPTLVFADAPKAKLLDTVLRSAFLNSGQICLCGSRLLVERAFYGEFRDALVAPPPGLPVTLGRTARAGSSGARRIG